MIRWYFEALEHFRLSQQIDMATIAFAADEPAPHLLVVLQLGYETTSPLLIMYEMLGFVSKLAFHDK